MHSQLGRGTSNCEELALNINISAGGHRFISEGESKKAADHRRAESQISLELSARTCAIR